MSFSSLKYVGERELGRQSARKWKDGLYSTLYTSVKPTKTTESTPCDGLDWGAVFGFGFASDGSLLAAACENKCMLIYDPNNAQLINRRFKTHTDCVNCVRFLDNRTFATCSDDSTVRLWDARFLSQEIRVLRGHTSWVKNIEYCSSEGKLITSGFDGNIFAWDINNYSESNTAEPLFYINGMMRTKMTPDENKMIVSTLGGYFLLIHDLDLDYLKEDLLGFKPHLYRLMQLMNTPLHHALQYNYMFARKRNRVEFMCDFPDADNAESISTMQVHPQGWCIASRNTTLDEESEWTCVHDIQAIGNGNKIDFFHETSNPVDAGLSRRSESGNSETVEGLDSGYPPGGNRSSFSAQANRLPPGNLLGYPHVFWDLQGVGRLSTDLVTRNQNSDEDGNDVNESDSDDDETINHDIEEDVIEEASSRNSNLAGMRRLLSPSSSSSSSGSSEVTSGEELSNLSFPSSSSSPVRPHDNSATQSSTSVLDNDMTTASSSAASSSTYPSSFFDRPVASSSSENNDARTRRRPSEENSFQHNVGINTRNDDRAPSGLVFYEAMTISRGGRVRRRMAIRHTDQDTRQPLSPRTGHLRIKNVRPRLLFYSEEPNVGRGFIKEQSFSPDGRVLASPFGNCVRLLAFNDTCSELCDNVPVKPRALRQIAVTVAQKSSILASTFSPTHSMFVAGAKDGSISFCSPRL